MFAKLKDELCPEVPDFCTICPTRWTVRAASMESIILNYAVFQALWEEAKDAVRYSETRARIGGVEAAMSSFSFFFGLILGERVLKHTDNLSKALQSPSLTAFESHQMAQLTRQTLSGIRFQEAFDSCWEYVLMFQAQKGVSEPSLPRKRRVPPGQEVGCSVEFNHETVKDLYRQQYYEILDFVISAINDRFNQPGYRILVSLENLLMKAARRENYQEDMKVVLDTYSDDFNP